MWDTYAYDQPRKSAWRLQAQREFVCALVRHAGSQFQNPSGQRREWFAPSGHTPLDFFVFHKFTSFSLVGGLRGGTSLAPHAARAHMRDALPRPGRCNAARRPRSTRHKAGGVEGGVARGRSILVAAVPLHYKWGVCAAHDSSRGRCAPAKLQNCQASDHS